MAWIGRDASFFALINILGGAPWNKKKKNNCATRQNKSRVNEMLIIKLNKKLS